MINVIMAFAVAFSVGLMVFISYLGAIGYMVWDQVVIFLGVITVCLGIIAWAWRNERRPS